MTSINIDVLRPSGSAVCPPSLRELPLPGRNAPIWRANLFYSPFVKTLNNLFSFLETLSSLSSSSLSGFPLLTGRVESLEMCLRVGGTDGRTDGRLLVHRCFLALGATSYSCNARRGEGGASGLHELARVTSPHLIFANSKQNAF